VGSGFVLWRGGSPILGVRAVASFRVGLSVGSMDRFVSHFTNRLDAKGRVSIPATFRAVLARDGFEGLYVHPALDMTALDAGGNALLKEIDGLLSRLPPYSDERDHLATALLGVSEVLKVDPEGRMQLSESLKAYASITDQITFVGLGQKFQIWEPEAFRARLEGARGRLRDLKASLGDQWRQTSRQGPESEA
jgi:MraZ protein